MKSDILKIILIIVVVVLAALALVCILDMVSALFVDTAKIYMKNSKYFRFLLYVTTALTILIGRIHIHTEGMDKLSEAGIEKNRRFLLVSNHKSNFDPIVTWHVFRKYDLAFLSKEENMHIFSFGRIIRKCCFMAIDRENPKNALKTLMTSSELIKNNEVSIAIYPEGTRNNGEGLLPFHNGIFKVAKMANVPVVVICVNGTTDIRHNFPFKKTDVSLKVLDIIDTEDVNELKTSEIGEIVREEILNNI